MFLSCARDFIGFSRSVPLAKSPSSHLTFYFTGLMSRTAEYACDVTQLSQDNMLLVARKGKKTSSIALLVSREFCGSLIIIMHLQSQIFDCVCVWRVKCNKRRETTTTTESLSLSQATLKGNYRKSQEIAQRSLKSNYPLLLSVFGGRIRSYFKWDLVTHGPESHIGGVTSLIFYSI